MFQERGGIPFLNKKIWAATWQNQQNECAPSENSDQPGNPPSLTRVFAVHIKNPWVLSDPLSAQQRLWSDWVDAQDDRSLRWAHTHFVGFVMSWLIYTLDDRKWAQNFVVWKEKFVVTSFFKQWTHIYNVIVNGNLCSIYIANNLEPVYRNRTCKEKIWRCFPLNKLCEPSETHTQKKKKYAASKRM